MRRSIIAAALTSMSLFGLAMADSTPVAAATSCSAASHRPTLIADRIKALGVVECTASIYRIYPRVELQRLTSDGWRTISAASTRCDDTDACGRAVYAGLASGTYRTRTSGQVQARSGAALFDVSPRLSSSLTI